MQKCLNCSHEQDMGAFCSKCGSPMQSPENADKNEGYDEKREVAATETYAQPKQSKEMNQNLEQVKQTAQNYMNSFIDLVKKPASAITNDTGFVNGIISFVLLSLLLGLATTGIVNKFFASILGLIGGFIGLGEKVFSVKYIFIFGLVFALLSLVTILTVFFANKLFVQERSFKSVFVSITNFYPIAIIVSLLAYLLALIGLPKPALYLFVIALTIIITLAPLFVMKHDMENKATKFDKFYIFILVSLVITLMTYIVMDISMSSILESYKQDVDLFDQMW